MDNINKEREYIKNLIYLNLQKKEISELMSKPLSKDKYKLKLINKDIINGYLDPQLNKEIMSLLNNQNKKTSEFNEQDINNIINNIMKSKNNKESIVEELALDFLFPEEFKLDNIDFPTNFYIITEEKFNKIFENNENLTDFKTYDAYLGKEGIFMWIEGNIESEGQTKDYKNVIYYISNNDYDDLKINKIFLYKNEEVLKEQLMIIINEGKEKYFKEKIIKKKVGRFNLINNGYIIGEYINVTKKVKDKNTQLSKSDYEPRGEQRIENEIKRIKEKEELTQLFLPYLLICFSKIEKLKRGLELNQKGLLTSLLKIIKNVENKEKNIGESINDFETEFKKKELIYKFSYPYDKKTEVFKNLIEM